MNKKFYVIEVFGGIEAFLRGPIDSEWEQERLAKRLAAAQDPGTDATFWLDIDENGVPELGSYPGGFVEEEDEQPVGDWYVVAGPKDVPGIPKDQSVHVQVDYTPHTWELFTETLNCAIAGAALNTAASVALNGDPAEAKAVFRAAQDNWLHYGAGDTEPSAAFAELYAARFGK